MHALTTTSLRWSNRPVPNQRKILAIPICKTRFTGLNKAIFFLVQKYYHGTACRFDASLAVAATAAPTHTTHCSGCDVLHRHWQRHAVAVIWVGLRFSCSAWASFNDTDASRYSLATDRMTTSHRIAAHRRRATVYWQIRVDLTVE